MKKSILPILISLLLCGGMFFFCIYQSQQRGKLAWVNINEVYAEFIFKKELEKKILQTQQARKQVTDSLEFELKVLSREIRAEKGGNKNRIQLFEAKREAYLQKKEAQEEDNAMLEKQYNEQILTQLNQYLKDYGKEKNLRYLFGTTGNGNLMYAEESEEVTKDVILYINEKYKGKTK
jgi:outer membrane protein